MSLGTASQGSHFFTNHFCYSESVFNQSRRDSEGDSAINSSQERASYFHSDLEEALHAFALPLCWVLSAFKDGVAERDALMRS